MNNINTRISEIGVVPVIKLTNPERDAAPLAKALAENGFSWYVRPDHGRMIWGETGKPGYGLFDRALGATYLNGLFEACEKYSK